MKPSIDLLGCTFNCSSAEILQIALLHLVGADESQLRRRILADAIVKDVENYVDYLPLEDGATDEISCDYTGAGVAHIVGAFQDRLPTSDLNSEMDSLNKGIEIFESLFPTGLQHAATLLDNSARDCEMAFNSSFSDSLDLLITPWSSGTEGLFISKVHPEKSQEIELDLVGHLAETLYGLSPSAVSVLYLEKGTIRKCRKPSEVAMARICPHIAAVAKALEIISTISRTA